MRSRKAPIASESWDVLAFMTEFARLLLAAGVSSSQFNQVAELAFFRAASEDARFRNSRINQSSVAAMTGLNRAKIRSLIRAEKKKSHSQSESRRERLLAAWMSEAEFLTSSGEPRRLRLVGKKGSFASLTRKHGGDVPPRALLRELLRRRLVRVTGEYAQLASNAREVKEQKRLEQISAALAAALSAPSGSSPGRVFKVMSYEVRHPAPNAVGRILLQRRIAKSLKGFMAELEVACCAIATESSQTGMKARRTGKTSVVLLNQD
jgi:Family of unknown function (DUF6502)